MNVIELQGKITNIYNGYTFTIVTLFIKDDKGDMVHDFEAGDYVNIHATMKTQMDITDEKKEFKQFIRGLWIGKVKNKLSEIFNEDLNSWYEYKNTVYIKGDILSVKQYGKTICKILVHPESENFNLILTQYTKEPEKLIKKYKNRTIYAIGCIQTIKKETADKPKYYQNIVVSGADVK